MSHRVLSLAAVVTTVVVALVLLKHKLLSDRTHIEPQQVVSKARLLHENAQLQGHLQRPPDLKGKDSDSKAAAPVIAHPCDDDTACPKDHGANVGGQTAVQAFFQ